MNNAHTPEPVPPIQDPGFPPAAPQDPVIPPDPAHPGSPPVQDPPTGPEPAPKKLREPRLCSRKPTGRRARFR